jgi:hypothetical protein
MAETRYRVTRGDPAADRERVLDLWARCGFASGEQAGERYDWFYLRNPRGPGRVYLLWQLDELVGALGAGSRRFICGAGEPPLNAAVLVDFVVHPAHRSMFPALQLQRFAREEELRETEMVYGLPDVKATPVFRRLGATAEFSSGIHVRVLRSGSYASRLLPRVPPALVQAVCWVVDRARVALVWAMCKARGLRTTWHREFPGSVDALWRLTAAQTNLATGERDLEFLRWRFASNTEEWRLLTVSRRNSEAGYFVCRREGNELQVFDFLVAHRDAATLPLLALSLAAWTLGVKSVRIVFGGFRSVQVELARAGFKLRDQRPCFLMQQKVAGARRLPDEWWLTRADEDV